MIIKQKLAGNIDFDYKWYDIYNCDDHDIRLLKDDFDLTSEIISYITDLHERPHFDHDYITNSDLLVYDVPVWPTADADHFTTLPIKFLMVGHTLFTVHSPDTTYMVEKSLVYLSSSIRTNLMMLESLKNKKSGLHMNASEEEMCDDIIIEVQQSSQMIKIYSEVTEEISKTSNNILNNNLNNTMQFLTVWSLLLTIPTIVTGFFGMNVDLPIFHNPFDWVIITVGSVIVMAILLWYLRRHNML